MIKRYFDSFVKEIIGRFWREGCSDFNSRPGFGPTDLVVSVTTRCNFSCPYCLRSLVDKNKTFIKDLPLSIFETVLKEGRKLNFQGISLTGGEPILHPEFKKMLAIARRENYHFSIISNAWLYKEYFPFISEYRSNLRWMVLSLDGVTAEVHDAVRNKPGSFKKVVEAMKFYKEKNAPVCVNSCITQKNLHQLEELPAFCLEHGVKGIRISAIISPYGEKSANFPADILTENERSKALEKISELQKKYWDRCSIRANPSFISIPKNQTVGSKTQSVLCPAIINRAIHLDHDGGMLFCCNIYKECEKKPLVGEIGFEKSYQITKKVAEAIREKFLLIYRSGNFRENYRICDFCNENVGACLDSALRD